MLTPTSPAIGTANQRARSRRQPWAGWWAAALLLGSGSASAQVTPDYVFNYSFHWRDITTPQTFDVLSSTPLDSPVYQKSSLSLQWGTLEWNPQLGEVASYFLYQLTALPTYGPIESETLNLIGKDDFSDEYDIQFNITFTNTAPVVTGLTLDIGQGENNVAVSLFSTASDANADPVYLDSFSHTAVTGYGSLIADPSNSHGVIFVRDPNAPLTSYTSTFSYVYNDLWQDSLSGTITLNVAAIPEPGHAAALVSMVVLALVLWRRKRSAAAT